MSRPTVLYYGDDARDVYVSWQWLEGDHAEPHSFRVARGEVDALVSELMTALPTRKDDERVEDAVERMLRTGPFARNSTERDLSRRLGDALLPRDLLHSVVAHAERTGAPVRFRVLPPASCARVPWELLVFDLDDGRGQRRLLDVADVVADAPAGIYAGRARQPEAWAGQGARGPAVHVIDPETGTTGHGQVLTREQAMSFALRHPDSRGVAERTVSRAHLSTYLRAEPRPSRLFYLGHVVSPQAQPGATSLLLSDGEDVYGVQPVVGATRPFSAFDVVEGTLFAAEREAEVRARRRRPARDIVWPTGRFEALAGSEIWPMPPRVALIACDSGADLGHPEPFGFVIACLTNGAGLVTATRWTLPADRAFRGRDVLEPGVDPEPLREMALAVDEAHAGDDPAGAIARWQRTRAALWDAAGDRAPAAHSPTVWASLTTYVAPRKELAPVSADDLAALT